MTTEASFEQALRILVQNEVEFIVVGGVGAILQGSPLSTEDLDVVYLSSEENRRRLIGALKQLDASYLDPADRQNLEYIESWADQLGLETIWRSLKRLAD